MASTNKTTNYELSQYVGSDKPTYLGDYNSDMLKIDTAMHANANAIVTADEKATTAGTNASTALTNAGTAQTTADTANATATSALSKATTNETNIVKLEGYSEYSQNETICGTWINGNPIYRKVIDFGALPNATYKNVPHGISNIERIVKIDGISNNNGNYSPLPLVYNSSESQFNTEISIGSTNITMRSTQNRSSITAYVIIEYTKTTD